ncbi:AraC family transcriptional regulator [Spartobacteria bacterium LR76]|nr:AraC family transcriptional regulator [Spartobacteria bacterium LR76]
MNWLDRISPRPNILWRGTWPARFVEPARYLYDHELVLVSRGEYLLRVGEQEWEMKPGMFAIIPPAANHVSIVRKGPVFRSCIHFDWLAEPAPARPICSYHPRHPAPKKVLAAPVFVPPGCMVGSFRDDGTITAQLDTLFFRWQTGDALNRNLCRGVLQEILLRLLWPRDRATRPAASSSQLAYAVKEVLDANALKGGSVQTLLADLGCSYAHACRVFHKSFGLTPVAYITAQRLERAKSLLGNSRLTVAEVGYESGFPDTGYFCKRFRQSTGLTPGAYRAKLETA